MPAAPADSRYASRLAALQGALAAAGLEGVVLNPSASFHHLTGLDFHVMERPVLLVVPAEGMPRLLLPELEALKLENAPFPLHHWTYGENPATWAGVAAHALGSLQKVGAEGRGLRLLELDLLRQARPGLEVVAADALIGAARACKDADEIELMLEATRIAEKAVEATLAGVREGMTEKELSQELVLQLLGAGSSLDLPFAPIVSFGENSANPHASPTDRRLRQGDLVLIDWGARYQGYASDLTRVYAFGDVPDELAHIAGVVERANAAGREATRPGVPAGDVDRAARGVIEREGYGALFVHRTGHGLGLETHEEPYMRGDNAALLEAGNVFTVEPGIYKAGLGGVRIEDDVVVTPTGARVLSTLPRGLRPIG